MSAVDDLRRSAAEANVASFTASALELALYPTPESIATLNDRLPGCAESFARTLWSLAGLQAAVAGGEPVYARLGYRNVGPVQMWERPGDR